MAMTMVGRSYIFEQSQQPSNLHCYDYSSMLSQKIDTIMTGYIYGIFKPTRFMATCQNKWFEPAGE